MARPYARGPVQARTGKVKTLRAETVAVKELAGDRPLSCRNIADPRAWLATPGHNPRAEVIRPARLPSRVIKDLDPRRSLRPAHLHAVRVLVPHRPPRADSIAGPNAGRHFKPNPQGWHAAWDRTDDWLDQIILETRAKPQDHATHW